MYYIKVFYCRTGYLDWGCNNNDRFCPHGMICKEELCIFLDSGPVCKSKRDCLSGYICLNGVCSKKLGPTKWTQNYVKYVNGLQADLMRKNKK